MRLSTLFKVKNGTAKSQVSVSDQAETEHHVRYVRPSQTLTGSIDGYVNSTLIPTDSIFPPETIYVSTDGQGSHTYSYVSAFDFVPNSNVAVLIPRREMNINEKMFYALCVTANRYKFSYGRKPKGDRLKNVLIPNQCPNFVYKDVFADIIDRWKAVLA